MSGDIGMSRCGRRVRRGSASQRKAGGGRAKGCLRSRSDQEYRLQTIPRFREESPGDRQGHRGRREPTAAGPAVAHDRLIAKTEDADEVMT